MDEYEKKTQRESDEESGRRQEKKHPRPRGSRRQKSVRADVGINKIEGIKKLTKKTYTKHNKNEVNENKKRRHDQSPHPDTRERKAKARDGGRNADIIGIVVPGRTPSRRWCRWRRPRSISARRSVVVIMRRRVIVLVVRRCLTPRSVRMVMRFIPRRGWIRS